MRKKIHAMVYNTDSRGGFIFEVILLLFVVMSIVVLMLESVTEYYEAYTGLFNILEVVFTVFFTLEFLVRVYAAHKKTDYIFSFYGAVDILSILPLYLLWLNPALKPFFIIRAMRLIRIFRIFKLDAFIRQGNIIVKALMDTRTKIIVFTFAILILVSIFGSIMYLVENGVNENFDSIPRSIYWTIVTITTVGYGDISPVTAFGQFMASVIMLSGYVIIAVPTGIITYSAIEANRAGVKKTTCPNCSKNDNESGAIFCSRCGSEISGGQK